MATAPGSAGVLPARVRMMESLKCDQLRAVLGALRVSKQGNKGALQERVLAQLSQPSPRERAAAEKAVADVYAAAHAVSLGPPPALASAPSPPAAVRAPFACVVWGLPPPAPPPRHRRSRGRTLAPAAAGAVRGRRRCAAAAVGGQGARHGARVGPVLAAGALLLPAHRRAPAARCAADPRERLTSSRPVALAHSACPPAGARHRVPLSAAHAALGGARPPRLGLGRPAADADAGGAVLHAGA